jgi:hypothetical protein
VVERWGAAFSMCTSTSVQRLALWTEALRDSDDCEHHTECRSGYCKHGYNEDEASETYGAGVQRPESCTCEM